MKTTKILSLFALGVFLVSTASALMVVDGMWADQSQTLEIEKGESASFDVYFVTYDYPMDIFVGMYNSNNQLVQTFIDDSTDFDFFVDAYEIRENVYENLGIYEIRISGSDNVGDSDNHVLTLKVVEKNGDNGNGTTDTTAPEITIYSPNAMTYTSQITELHYRISDANLDVCEYSTDNGETRNALACHNGEDAFIYLNSKVGQNKWTIYATDEYGNEASKTIIFSVTLPEVDETAPEITIVSPEEDKEYSKREIKFKVLTNEDADVWFSVDGKANITMENLEDHIFTYTIKLSDGNHEVVFYATDEAGNLRIKDVEFSIDTNDEDDNDRKSSISGGIVDDELDRERYLTQFESKTINVGEESEATTKGVSNWFIWLIVGLIVLIVLIIVVVMMR